MAYADASVDDLRRVLTGNHATLGLTVLLHQCVFDGAEALATPALCAGQPHPRPLVLEVHHQPVVHRVERHLHRRGEAGSFHSSPSELLTVSPPGAS